MAIKVNNKTSYELGNNLTEFFSVPIEVSESTDEYSRLKDDVYKLDIDNEEKANIINKINSLRTVKTANEKRKIQKEIDEFFEENNI